MRKHGGMLKTLEGFKTAMIETLFRSRVVRRRMADSHLGIILPDFALFLEARGHVLTSRRSVCCCDGQAVCRDDCAL
jgi:hypothetical protein